MSLVPRKSNKRCFVYCGDARCTCDAKTSEYWYNMNVNIRKQLEQLNNTIKNNTEKEAFERAKPGDIKDES